MDMYRHRHGGGECEISGVGAVSRPVRPKSAGVRVS